MSDDEPTRPSRSAAARAGSRRSDPTAAAPAAEGVPGDRPAPRSTDVTFLTVAEVATMMRVSKMTVYRLVHAGDLPAIRVGRSFRVPEQAVHDYLQNAFVEAG